jgi:hypothetical protein
MFQQSMEMLRKASEASLQFQQDLLRQWSQQWLAAPAGASAERARDFQKRCLGLTLEILNKHRESLDTGYKAGIQAMEETFRLAEGKSPEEYRRTAEDLWRKLFDTFRGQYETQMHELQKFASMSFDIAQNPANSGQARRSS